jgi:hypothetical protein
LRCAERIRRAIQAMVNSATKAAQPRRLAPMSGDQCRASKSE